MDAGTLDLYYFVSIPTDRMAPKKSDIHHVTFHFHRSAVLLSVPASTSLASLKSQLIPALVPLASTLPQSPRTSADDIRLYDQTSDAEGEDTLRDLESDGKAGLSRSISGLGWSRWKRVFVSFRGEDGDFADPVYTIPDVDDEVPDET